MKDATKRCFGVTDDQGNVIASSDLSMMGYTISEIAPHVADMGGELFTAGSRTCRALGAGGRDSYVVFVDGTDELARSVCIMAAVALGEAKSGYDDKHNTATFVKNIISDNILPGDVYVRAKELHFSAETPRGVFIVRQEDGADVAVMEYLQNLYPARDKDFVLSMSETDVVVIRELPAEFESEELERTAEQIQTKLEKDLGVKCVVGIGSPVMHLRELADRYKEAQTAIEVGKVFDTEKTVISYESLGIGRIIYQLPTTLCEMFLAEVFKKNPIESLDQETLYTINKFFENNLNVSETSRKLFVHRNTLVYRLEKIKKLTGLDLREFDHAIVFKVALMVKRYLDTQNIRY
ncbi:MAG: PucR family transcriptional regulator [Oscillospiraceae bacterium]